ncbi:MAG: hypothetical protein ACUVRG_07465 [Ignavibacterium sp.]
MARFFLPTPGGPKNIILKASARMLISEKSRISFSSSWADKKSQTPQGA